MRIALTNEKTIHLINDTRYHCIDSSVYVCFWDFDYIVINPGSPEYYEWKFL